jgi:hypothetical protein
MPTTAVAKTWKARVEFTAEGKSYTLDAEASRWDTLRETVKAATDEAATYLRAGLATEARIHMYKTTKARGTEYDRQAAYLWVEDGKVLIDRS